MTFVLTPEKLLRRDMEYGGSYRIVGPVDELGVLGRYRVRLYDRRIGTLVRETFSDALTGVYSFQNIALKNNGYFTVAFDHAAPWRNAAVADLITPEAMP